MLILETKFQINDSRIHLRKGEKEGKIIPKANRKNKIMKVRAKILAKLINKVKQKTQVTNIRTSKADMSR